MYLNFMHTIHVERKGRNLVVFFHPSFCKCVCVSCCRVVVACGAFGLPTAFRLCGIGVRGY